MGQTTELTPLPSSRILGQVLGRAERAAVVAAVQESRRLAREAAVQAQALSERTRELEAARAEARERYERQAARVLQGRVSGVDRILSRMGVETPAMRAHRGAQQALVAEVVALQGIESALTVTATEREKSVAAPGDQGRSLIKAHREREREAFGHYESAAYELYARHAERVYGREDAREAIAPALRGLTASLPQAAHYLSAVAESFDTAHVARSMKEEKGFLVHTLNVRGVGSNSPLRIHGGDETSQPIDRVTEHKMGILMGLEPTISCSSYRYNGSQAHIPRFGSGLQVVVTEGLLDQARTGDGGTTTVQGGIKGTRRHHGFDARSDLGGRLVPNGLLPAALHGQAKREDLERAMTAGQAKYNEITVENPGVGALLLNVNQGMREWDVPQAVQEAKDALRAGLSEGPACETAIATVLNHYTTTEWWPSKEMVDTLSARYHVPVLVAVDQRIYQHQETGWAPITAAEVARFSGRTCTEAERESAYARALATGPSDRIPFKPEAVGVRERGVARQYLWEDMGAVAEPMEQERRETYWTRRRELKEQALSTIKQHEMVVPLIQTPSTEIQASRADARERSYVRSQERDR